MARIRTIKPDFFLHEGLAELSMAHRLLFIGLWTQADRAGRLEDRPKRLKAAILPYDDCDVDALLGDLAAAGFLTRYAVDGRRYIAIPTFGAHQRCHARELPSSIPPPPVPRDAPEHSLGDARHAPKHNLGDARHAPEHNLGHPGTGTGREQEQEQEQEQDPPPSPPPSAPVVTRSLTLAAGGGALAAVSADFDRIWAAYPRKTGKAAARKAWGALRPRPPTAVVLQALDWQRQQPEWLREGGRFIPHLATWLRAGRWEDEPPALPLLSDVGAHNLAVLAELQRERERERG